MEKKKYTLEEMRERMLAYMTEKYKEEFKMTGIGQTNLFGNRYGATVDSKKNPQYIDIGVYWDIVDGEVVITDDYSMFLTDPLVGPYVGEALKETFLNTRYNFTASARMKDMSEPYNYSADIYEYLQTDISSLGITLSIPEEDEINIENKIQSLVKFIEKSSGNDFYVNITVSIIPLQTFEHDVPLYEEYYKTQNSDALVGKEWPNNVIREYYLNSKGDIEKFEYKKKESSQ